MKTPEELAKEFSKVNAETDVGALGCYRQGLYEGFLAGYQAAASQWISVKESLPLFISQFLAVSKHGRQFICWFDHETITWDLDHAAPLVEGDRIIAWTQIELPKLSDE
jgi:hypothetical protein